MSGRDGRATVRDETVLRAVTRATGLARRKAFAAIREGRVSEAGARRFDPSSAYGGGELALDGEPLRETGAKKTYVLLNKPPGYLSTTFDDRGRPTVLDLVPDELRVAGLHPVGRLDQDTTGLLVLTNDGELTYRLTHPKHEVLKEYWAAVRPRPDERTIDALGRGVEIDGVLRRPVAVARLEGVPGFQLSVTLGEGRKRQVRQMMEAVGLRVRGLHRAREGRLGLDDLAEGQVRLLRRAEVALLEAAPESEPGGRGARSSKRRGRGR